MSASPVGHYSLMLVISGACFCPNYSLDGWNRATGSRLRIGRQASPTRTQSHKSTMVEQHRSRRVAQRQAQWKSESERKTQGHCPRRALAISRPVALIYVASSGTGTVSITGGGVVSSGRFIIGENAGSNGTATVFGSGSMWTNIAVCDRRFRWECHRQYHKWWPSSNSNGPSIGENMGTGTVIVDGMGSTWSEDAWH